MALVTTNSSDWWNVVFSGVHKYERETGVRVVLRMPPNGTAEEQNDILKEFVKSGYDAVAISVVSPSEQTSLLNAVAAKTNLITFDSDAPRSTRVAHVGTDNYLAGRALGNEANVASFRKHLAEMGAPL